MSKLPIAALGLMAACAVATVSAPAQARVITSFFGWNYVGDSAGTPPAAMTLTSITYLGGTIPTAGLVITMPAFPGYTGMPDGIPIRSGATFGDTGSGMTLALEILAAYIQRLRTGEGQMVEVAMQEAVANFVRTAISFTERSGHPAARRANRSGAGGAPTDLFPCAPGGPNDYVYVMVNTSRFWDALCIAIDRPDLAADERFCTPGARRANVLDLYPIVTEWTQKRTKWEAMEELSSHGVPSGAVFDSRDLFEHPHLLARGGVTTIDHPVRGKWQLLSPPFHMTKSCVALQRAPLLGEHTDEVLSQELALDPAALENLASDGITAPASAASRRSKQPA